MDDGRQCVSCRASNPVDARWCGQCFERFDTTRTPQGSAVTAPVPGQAERATGAAPEWTRTWSCGSCAAENPVTADHCVRCRTPIAASLGALEGGGVASVGRGLPRMRRPRQSFGRRLHVGFRLVGIGFETASENPRLLAAPFLSGVATLAVAGLVWLIAGIGPMELAESEKLGFAEWVAIGVVTYCGALFAVLAESFVVAAATLHFDRADTRAQRVWSVITPRLGSLVRWAFTKATVSLVFQALRQKLPGGTRRGATSLGLDAAEAAWATLTVLVVPVILYEGETPGKAIRRSTSLFRRTWGQTLVGGFGLGLALTALMLAAIVVTVPLVMLNPGFGVTVAIVMVVVIQLVGSVAAGALVAALYRFATTGNLPRRYSRGEVSVGA